MRRQSMAATVILPKHETMVADAAFRPPQLDASLAVVSNQRGLGVSPLILASGCGTRTYEFTRGGKPSQYLLLGGLTIEDGLRLSHINALDVAAESRIENLEALLKVGAQSVVIDLGAGLNANRIKALQKICTQKGATFVAHDVVPELARVAQALSPTPYVVVPPYAQFLNPVFTPGRPVILTMHNVLSSMQADSMGQLMTACKGSNVTQCMITQSLGVADASDFWQKLPPYSDGVRDAMQKRIPSIAKTFPGISPEVVRVAFEEQARHAMFGFANCMVAANISAAAELKSDFKGIRVLLESGYTHMPISEALEYLRAISPGELPSLKIGLDAGEFNTVIVGPHGRGLRLQNRTDVPRGMCGWISTQYHIELGGADLTNDNSDALLAMGISTTTVPDLFAGISSAAVTEAEIRNRMRMDGQGAQTIEAGMVKLRPKLAEVLCAGTDFAAEHVFDVLGTSRQSPYLVPFGKFAPTLLKYAHWSVIESAGKS